MNKLISIISKFATNWILILYIVYLGIMKFTNIHIPLFITNFIISAVMTTSIYGSILMQSNYQFIQNKFPTVYPYVTLLDILFHYIPFIMIIKNKQTYQDKSTKKTDTDTSKIKSIILLFIFLILYIFSIKDISKIYFGVNDKKLISTAIAIFTVTLYTI